MARLGAGGSTRSYRTHLVLKFVFMQAERLATLFEELEDGSKWNYLKRQQVIDTMFEEFRLRISLRSVDYRYKNYLAGVSAHMCHPHMPHLAATNATYIFYVLFVHAPIAAAVQAAAAGEERVGTSPGSGPRPTWKPSASEVTVESNS